MTSANNVVLRATQVQPLQSTTGVLTLAPTGVLRAEDSGGSGSGGSGNGGGSTVTVTASPNSDAEYTSGQMAGVGVGVGIPLLLTLLGAIFIIFRQRKQLRPQRRSPSSEQLQHLQPAQSPGPAYSPPSNYSQPPASTQPGPYGAYGSATKYGRPARDAAARGYVAESASGAFQRDDDADE